jgi:hypothetical protein
VTSTGGSASGGLTSAGGTTSTGGTVSTGGTSSRGGTTATGGTTPTGGTTANGGATSAGGNSATGGNSRAGGATSTGGNSATGGSTRTGGATGTGGSSATGGRRGGATGTGGSSATGGRSGGATGTAGTTATGGATTSACGASGTTYDTSAVTTVCPGAVPAGITSAFCNCVNEGPGFSTSGFTVANNVWGSGPGPECVWATTSTLWGVTANHPQTSGVKSYPNIGISPRKLISSINTYTSSFDITVPGNVGAWEAAYDIWVKAPTGNTRIEIMLWFYTYRTGPISSVVGPGTPTIGGHTWTVHYGSNGSNATISLVRSNITSATVDVKAILDWLIANNPTTYGQFDNTWTLDQVQWGFEISGDGGATQEFINNCFSVSST